MTSTRYHSGIGQDVQRINFRHIRAGMTLLWKHKVIGRVTEREFDDQGYNAVLALDNGQRLTARGWSNRSLWRIVD